MRILAIYTFAVAAALFLMFLSPLLMLANPLAPVTGVLLLVSGALVAAFVYDYMNYAVREWGEFVPQGAALSALFVLSYTVMYMSLMASVITRGAGGANLVIWASFLASAALVFYIMRNVPLHIVGTDPLRDVAAGVKTLPLALLIGFPLGMIVAVFYESVRMIRRGAAVAGASAILSILSLPLAAPFISADLFTISVFSPFIMQTGVDVLMWPGVIAWEELTTRFLLPAAGPLANYMFVVLHAPSRWITALFLAPAVLSVISMGTRWLTDVYKRHGLIGSIAGHAIYNGMLGWLIGLIYFPLLTVATLAVLVIAYIYVKNSET